MKNSIRFELFFEGPALDNGHMSVRELAPSLLALGEAFENANKALNGNKTKIGVFVKAGFQKGSFGVELETLQSLAAITAPLFGQAPIQTAADIATLLGFLGVCSKGLINILKDIKNRKISKVQKTDEGIFLSIEGDGNSVQVYQISPPEFELLQDRDVRKSIEGVLRPLQPGVIDSIKIRQDGVVKEKIEANEASFFKVPNNEEQILEDNESEEWVSIHSIHFGTDKWRFSSGENHFWAIIEDQQFLAEVDRDERAFSKGDLLKVKIKKTFYETPNGVRTEYKIIKLLEHRKGMKQIRMGF